MAKAKKNKTKNLVLMGIMTAIIFVMGLTPIGYIKTGTLSIALITIPVAIAAFALGPQGGALAGLSFGITSAIVAFTNPSALMVALTDISPVRTVILCVVPRVLVGLLAGTIAQVLKTIKVPAPISGGITGFSVAFLNTIFFMSTLLMMFGDSETVKGMEGHQNLVLFIIAVVTLNVAIEWISCTVITSAVALALSKAGFISTPKKKASAH
ncbi:ECF transporter S component [Ruminococcus sp.]|uniref:ECF transporter S component n=1 Tax=Ruminococcus sp. TaxID=41978 RepID=UPI0025885C11|nr:ECF transporter S component [Ruminococcus sp.]MCR5021449.1 ECF transporter S component [Ruminococcus sp.]